MINQFKTYNQLLIVIASRKARLERWSEAISKFRFRISFKEVASRWRTCQRAVFAMTMTSIFLFTSCEEKIEWQLETENVNTIVVDGIITNEVKYQQIRLTKPYTSQNDQPESVSGAIVKVLVDNIQVQFIESPENPGYYLSEIPAAASIDKTYKLQIQVEDQEYKAEAYMVPVIPTGPPAWIYDLNRGLYTISWPASQYSQFEQAMYEADISWTHLLDSAYVDSISTAKLMFYTFNTIDVSYVIFPQDKEEVYFPRYSKAVVKKYSLTDEYASFLRALLAETEWQGSLFEDARGNLPGNISNGGLGYFSACSVIADTLVVGL